MVTEEFLIKKHSEINKEVYYNSTTKEFDFFEKATRYSTYPEALERVGKLDKGIYKIIKTFKVS